MNFRKDKMTLRRIDESYDSLWQSLGMVSASNFIFCNKSQSSLISETPKEEIYDNWVPFEGSVFTQIRGIQRKPLPPPVIFQVPTVQNSQYN